MKKREIRLYNMIFPIWMLMLFPGAWAIALPANFLIDSAVLLIAMKAMRLTEKKTLYKSCILKVWAFGFLADLIGALFLLAAILLDGVFEATPIGQWWVEHITNAVALNPFENIAAFLWVSAGVFISGVFLYLFHFKFSFKKLGIEVSKKKRLALALAVFTAPYLFYLPTIWFYR